MPNSYAQTAELTCPDCGRSFATEIWLIIDTGERADLLEQAREGILHDLPCPHCGHEGQMDAPSLIYQPEGEPRLIFSPAQNTTAEQDQEQAGGLLGYLREQLGPDWDDAWLEEIATVPRGFLAAVLSDNPEAALADMQAQAAAQLAHLQEEDPEAYQQLLEQAQAAGVDALPPLVLTLLRFIDADTWDESQRIVEATPELLTDEADALLGQLLDAAQRQGDEDDVAIFKEHQELLRRCREVGIKAAFEERTGGGDAETLDLPDRDTGRDANPG